MGVGLARLREEDPSFVVERNSETHQTLLGGQGDIQLGIILAKLRIDLAFQLRLFLKKSLTERPSKVAQTFKESTRNSQVALVSTVTFISDSHLQIRNLSSPRNYSVDQFQRTTFQL